MFNLSNELQDKFRIELNIQLGCVLSDDMYDNISLETLANLAKSLCFEFEQKISDKIRSDICRI